MCFSELCVLIVSIIRKEGGYITLYERIISEQKRLDSQICQIKEIIKTLPDGKLICCKHNNYSKWYHSDGHHRTYIPKKKRKFAEQLAQKKYLQLQLDDLEKEKNALEFYLRHHHPSGKAEQMLIDSSEYQNLLAPYFSPLSSELSQWMNEEYDKNLSYPETMIYDTVSGNVVRSKSEVLIDTFLYNNNIPFRYECALSLNDIVVYPDFTIRHPKTGDYYYWEHFGMMDKESYINIACSKIQKYASCGIVPGIQLITTYETKENPLSAEVIEKIIKHYFL